MLQLVTKRDNPNPPYLPPRFLRSSCPCLHDLSQLFPIYSSCILILFWYCTPAALLSVSSPCFCATAALFTGMQRFSKLPRAVSVLLCKYFWACLLTRSLLAPCFVRVTFVDSAAPKSEFFVDILPDSVSAMDLYGSSMKVVHANKR